MLRKICQEHTLLSDTDIAHLELTEGQLPLMAELTGADVFIDCMTKDGAVMVVAQARPHTLGSAYQQDVVGHFAHQDNEPAVFQTLQTGAPARDIKAVTQENQTVRQDVVPTQITRPPFLLVSLRIPAVSALIIHSSACI